MKADDLHELEYIPDVYKFNSVVNRREFLRGYLETNESAVIVDNEIEVTTHLGLVDDLRFLVWSLGGTARKLSDKRLRICLPAELSLLLFGRENIVKSESPCRRLVSAEVVGYKQAKCIALDSGNQLYVTDDFVVTHNSGTGKAPPTDSKILTPGGWKLMGEIEIGDDVVNPEGGVAQVVGIFPQGERDIYRVRFSDGASTECDREHLWKVLDSNKKWQVRELGRSMDKVDFERSPHYIPLAKAMDFESEKELSLSSLPSWCSSWGCWVYWT